MFKVKALFQQAGHCLEVVLLDGVTSFIVKGHDATYRRRPNAVE
jgi:hypothetical protein